MLSHRRVFFMLALLVLTSLSPAFMKAFDSQNNELSLEENPSTDFTEQQKLELASENWHIANSEAFTGFGLDSKSSIIHLDSFSFDPLVDQIPHSDFVIAKSHIPLQTGLVIIQLQSLDNNLIRDLESDYDFSVLDFLSGGSFDPRLPENTIQSFELLSEDPRVRWVGEMEPEWRVSEDIFSVAEDNTIFMLPTEE